MSIKEARRRLKESGIRWKPTLRGRYCCSLKLLRQDHGMSIKQLADESGMSEIDILLVENAVLIPNLLFAYVSANFFDKRIKDVYWFKSYRGVKR